MESREAEILELVKRAQGREPLLRDVTFLELQRLRSALPGVVELPLDKPSVGVAILSFERLLIWSTIS